MSAPAANKPVGDFAILQISTDSSSGFISLGAFEEISGNKIVSDEVEITKLSDTTKQFQAGIANFGEVSFKIRFNASMNSVIAGYQINKTPLAGKIAPADILLGSTRNSDEIFLCFFKEFDPYGTLQTNKEIISSGTLKVNGTASFLTGA